MQIVVNGIKNLIDSNSYKKNYIKKTRYFIYNLQMSWNLEMEESTIQKDYNHARSSSKLHRC